MLKEGNYDVFEFPFPPGGLNRSIDRDVLDPSFGWWVENILPGALGSGVVRYGTAQSDFSFADPAVAVESVLEVFPFNHPNGNQIILYASVWVFDQTITEASIPNSASVRFKTNGSQKYQLTTKIRITYRLPNDLSDHYLVTEVSSRTSSAGFLVLEFTEERFPPGSTCRLIEYCDGQIFAGTSALTLQKQDLSSVCVPRSVFFQGKLVICNGVDRLLQWDGTALTEIFDWVKESGGSNVQRTPNVTRVFSYTVAPGVCRVETYIGNKIRIKVLGQSYDFVVSSATLIGPTLTVTVTTDLPVFSSNEGSFELFYCAFPPRMSFLFAAHDRLWGLGQGAVSLNYRTSEEAMKVYYSYKTLSVSSWFTEDTRIVPYLNLSNKQELSDNLEAISSLDGKMIFFGRNQTQIWAGNQPPINKDLGNFHWVATKGVGIPHGNLIIRTCNDLYFATMQGVRSIGTLNIGNQVAVDPQAEGATPLVQKFMGFLSIGESSYRKCRAWVYNRGNLAAFKIGNQKVLASQINVQLKNWFVLSGDFEYATTIFEHLDSNLYLCIGGRIFQYGDSSERAPSFGDRGGTYPIPFSWSLPTLRVPGKRVSVRRAGLVVHYPTDLTEANSPNRLELTVYGDLRTTFSKTVLFPLQRQGDSIETRLLALQNGRDMTRYHLGEAYTNLTARLACVGSRLEFSIHGFVQAGPIIFRKLRLFTIVEP